MTNEFIHKDVGSSLSEAEYDGVGAHVFNSQATGDIMYASSATQLSRLAAGTQGYPLVMGASVPQWGGAITLNGTVTLNSQAFDAGSGNARINTTGASSGLLIYCTNDGSFGAVLQLRQITANPANGDRIGRVVFVGSDTGGTINTWGEVQMRIIDVTEDAEEVGFRWFATVGGAEGANEAMTLSGAGGLGIDSDIGTADDPVALFDDKDDALVLKQAIQHRNHELLVDMGVFSKKDTGSGYMMNIQPMTRLLAGGIYQNRALIDNQVKRLEGRLNQIEKTLPVGRGIR